MWYPVKDNPLPPSGEVLAFHPTWVDEDFNPDGVRVGFLHDEGYFISSKWCDNQDTYVNHEETMPTHWTFIIGKPNGFVRPEDINIDPRFESVLANIKHNFNGSLTMDISPKGTVVFLFAGHGIGVNQSIADMMKGATGFLRSHYPKVITLMNDGKPELISAALQLVQDSFPDVLEGAEIELNAALVAMGIETKYSVNNRTS